MIGAADPRSCCAGGGDARASPQARQLPQRSAAQTGEPVLKHRWSRVIGGGFTMGSDGGFIEDGEGPPREVTVSPFAIACHAVSNAHFAAFVRATGYVTDAEQAGWSYVFAGLVPAQAQQRITSRAAETPWWLLVSRAYWAQPEGPHSNAADRPDHPAVHVSWNDAKAYCEWAGTRLSSEAEWEFAARGGLHQALYPWGDDLTPEGEHRCNIWQGKFPNHNSMDDGYAGTAPVHTFKPNGFGLHNMAGNVWEWCEDNFANDYHRRTAAIDPLCDDNSERRTLRGGSYLCHDSYCNRYRVAARSANTETSSAGNIGFRVVNRR